ncbi:MAG: BtrH N-terminal domain-containing protein [Desulfobacterales bacterium]|nr:BtrH N-terminal domain-containing protein [Desulfobacterales bacterium]
MFRDKGVDISEPMVFGIGSGIFFGHLPFVKWQGLPISTFRSQPGAIFRKTAKRLGGKFCQTDVFAIRKKAWMNCGACLKPDRLSALTTNIYWLSYFPERFRFNFNGHNIIVLREIENGFRVSDPTFEHPVDCSADDLERARFAHGPAGTAWLYVLSESVNPHPDLRTGLHQGYEGYLQHDAENSPADFRCPRYAFSG